MTENGTKHVNALLLELGGKMGIPALSLDGRGARSLRIGGRVFTLQYVEQRDELYCICTVGELSPEWDRRAAAQTFLLDRNCFFRGVGIGVLGVRKGESDIFYTVRFPCSGLEFQEFESLFQAIVTAAGKIAGQLDEAVAATGEKSGAAAGFSDGICGLRV
ncbi:MAG: type III secretion system chaperone [Desulfovibrio sp.]|jgi:hypothetical protein|nr:type III secretion system chaperone [Desulfovibrio sp.]